MVESDHVTSAGCRV